MSALQVTFHGVRGSTPCHGDDIVRHGGNTSCVSVDVPGEAPVVLDLGTGLRYFGMGLDPRRPFTGTALLTHLHWDHTQGLPFFGPMVCPDTVFDVFGPAQEDRTLRDLFVQLLCPPQFPLSIEEFPGLVRFHDVESDDWSLGSLGVRSRPVPHIGPTVGYRLTWRGATVAYVPDHQQPLAGWSGGAPITTDAVLDLIGGVDLLIHDAQYSPREFERKGTWGHSTYQYAVELAAAAGVKRLALFHHDPGHDDDEVECIEAESVALGASRGVDVFAARERMTVSVPAHAA